MWSTRWALASGQIHKSHKIKRPKPGGGIAFFGNFQTVRNSFSRGVMLLRYSCILFGCGLGFTKTCKRLLTELSGCFAFSNWMMFKWPQEPAAIICYICLLWIPVGSADQQYSWFRWSLLLVFQTALTRAGTSVEKSHRRGLWRFRSVNKNSNFCIWNHQRGLH